SWGDAMGALSEQFRAILESRMAVLATVITSVVLVASAVAHIIPWYLFFVLLLLAVVLFVAFAFGRQWWSRRKDASLEAGLEAQNARAFGKLRVREREEIKELQQRWRESLEQLRQSAIGKKKRWLYHLPWYVIIGAPACGKTTAIQSS